MRCSIGNYKFEWSRMTSFEGDTGASLSHASAKADNP